MGMPAVPDTVTTIDELLALPDDGMRHELLDGVHAVTPAPTFRHQSVLATLFAHLRSAIGDARDWKVLWSPADLILGPRTLVQPDLFVIRVDPERGPRTWRDVGVPLMAIEVLSPGTAARDRGAKRRIYQTAGVGEYWIVDIDSRVVERWRPQDERPEVCVDAIEWTLEDGPSGSLNLGELFE
jgi:Uma2 family endonuclease